MPLSPNFDSDTGKITVPPILVHSIISA